MATYAKAIHASTLELRVIKINRAVEQMLIDGAIHWARTRSPLGDIRKVDVLLIDSDDVWQKLLPYFDHREEKQGRKHGIRNK